MKKQLLAWWQSKPQREQYVLATVAGLMGLVLVWQGIVLPVNNAIITRETRIERLKSDSEWAASQARKQGLLAAIQPALLESVKQSAEQVPLQLHFQESKGYIIVAPTRVKMNDLYAWIYRMQVRGIAINELVFSADAKHPGHVQLEKMTIKSTTHAAKQ